MATTKRQRQISASLLEISALISSLDKKSVSAAKKPNEGFIHHLGKSLKQEAKGWLRSTLPSEVADITDLIGEYASSLDEQEEEQEKEVEVDVEVVSEEEDTLYNASSKIDEVIKKFKKQPGSAHVDDLVKALTEYTKEFNNQAQKKEKEKKVKEKVFKPFSEQFD